jgi:hypothetical protein
MLKEDHAQAYFFNIQHSTFRTRHLLPGRRRLQWGPTNLLRALLMLEQQDLNITTLGTCRIESPLAPLLANRHQSLHYVEESDRVLFDDTLSAMDARKLAPKELPSFEPAGPRRRIFFDPSKVRAGIVTCGGLCPGLNDVIRALVLELRRGYGVHHVYGFCNGYQGFIPKFGRCVLELDRQTVSDINEHGGTMLGTSRGEQDPIEIVDCLERMSINALFVIGGDGTIRGAMAIAREVAARGLKIAVVGIPKTIDNDIMFIEQSFGFQTAFSEATRYIRAVHVEATGIPNGVGLVKLMGRHSGFIACYASLAMSDANFVLIPEVPLSSNRHERFLRDIHAADALHALLAFFLFFQQFALAGDVAAVAFGGDVLADGFDRLAGDDLAADGRLQRDLEQMPVDLLLQSDQQLPAALLGMVAVHDHAQGVDAVAVDEDVHLDQIAGAEADQIVVHRAVAARGALEAVVKIVNHLRQRHLVNQDHARRADVFGLLVNAAAVLAQLHQRADAVAGEDQIHQMYGSRISSTWWDWAIRWARRCA